ncbi:MAG TPA: hypothetical protein VFU80_07735, partial [Sphingomicrobium sp.]|nr:hypothetical protein [Sphingomicrobium sp.]
ALLIAVATGFLDITQTRQAEAPDLSVNRTGVAARGGKAPTFDIETGSVSVGTRQSNVVVPTVRVNPPENQAAADAANAVANNAN